MDSKARYRTDPYQVFTYLCFIYLWSCTADLRPAIVYLIISDTVSYLASRCRQFAVALCILSLALHSFSIEIHSLTGWMTAPVGCQRSNRDPNRERKKVVIDEEYPERYPSYHSLGHSNNHPLSCGCGP